jgi:CRP-like cAMP-binding protein
VNLEQCGNRLLRSLAGADVALLAPHCREMSLRQGLILQEQEAPFEQVYFPLSGVISLVTVMEDGDMIQTAMVGSEGAVGGFGGFGPCNAFSRALVQLPGEAVVIPVARFQAAVGQSNRIRNLILRYREVLLAQVQQTAACNALHPMEARLARWLLQVLDRVDDPNLPLTQDFIAQMLGAQRSTVSAIAHKLQEAGLISYSRGHILVLDWPMLEETACECYRAIRRRRVAMFRTEQERSGGKLAGPSW